MSPRRGTRIVAKLPVETEKLDSLCRGECLLFLVPSGVPHAFAIGKQNRECRLLRAHEPPLTAR